LACIESSLNNINNNNGDPVGMEGLTAVKRNIRANIARSDDSNLSNSPSKHGKGHKFLLSYFQKRLFMIFANKPFSFLEERRIIS
jgi:hypothetical protein